MNGAARELRNDGRAESADSLLDLGEFEPIEAADADDFVLDLDQDETSDIPFQEPQVSATASMRALSSRECRSLGEAWAARISRTRLSFRTRRLVLRCNGGTCL